MTEKTGRCWIWNLRLLGIGFAVGLTLRLYYATHSHLYIDEFTTIWAAQRVLSEGLPRFPLGAIYTQGLFFTYLEAGAQLLGRGFHPFLARWPSLVLSAMMLALMVYAARKLFGTLPVGLAALWLALDGQAIIWGSRARTYALLQPLVLVAFLAWYQGAIAADRPRPRWLAIGLLLVALVDQQVTLLLLPPLVLLALAARGWGWLRQPVVWLQAGVMALGLVGRWFLYQLMVLPGTVASAEPRAFVDLVHPFDGWENVLPLLTDPNRLLALLLLAGGVIWLLVRRPRGLPAWGPPVVSIAFTLAFLILEMLLAVGTTWRRARYLDFAIPLLFLAAEGVAVPALHGLARRLSFLPFRRALVALTAAFVLFVVGIAVPGARAAATSNEWGYDRAMAWVGQNWEPGDALATTVPAAAFVVLGHAEFFAVEEGVQAMVGEQEGRRFDSWTGLTLLDTPERLQAALDAPGRLWFVADEMRLDRQFSPEYLRLLWDRFDLVAFEWGTFVFRSRPPEPAPDVERAVDVDLAGQLRLVGYTVSDDRPEPGETITVTLYWEPIVPQGEYVASVRLVSADGTVIARHEAPLLGGLYPAFRWGWSPDSLPLPDRHTLTLPDLPPGRYRLEVGLHQPDTTEPVGQATTLDFLTVGRENQPAPMNSNPVARFGNAVILLSHELSGTVAPGNTPTLRLLWQTGPAGFDADYTLFIHLVDEAGQIVQQWDAPPADGDYPTGYWDPGEIVEDDHNLPLSPQLPAGDYRLILGLYREDGARLPLDAGTDSYQVAEVQIGS